MVVIDELERNWKEALVFNRGSKSKAIPLQAWAGPEGSRRFRLPDF
jgi:hypothetical protein